MFVMGLWTFGRVHYNEIGMKTLSKEARNMPRNCVT